MTANATAVSRQPLRLASTKCWLVAACMAITAEDALRRAADRSTRRIDLEIAHKTLERTLGYEIDADQAP